MFVKSLSKVAVLLCLSSFTTTLYAGIVITGTRVIYPAEQKTVTVQVKNDGAYPALMQTWIDDGDANLAPDEINVPFVITPPISRLDASVGQTINISMIEDKLPKDRESIFWLNVLDIPARPQDNDSRKLSNNMLQIAVRSRIKMFYRPTGLKDQAKDAAKLLQWTQNNQNISVKNPSPYYISVSSLLIPQPGAEDKMVLKEGIMLAPFESKNVEIKEAPFKSFTVQSINDYGGLDRIEVSLNQ
ncbi:P pilus assembly chaperone PapD [Acinetobacter calcoaceticus]|uniref:P pilus assembly chaperone PapD n=1 Tax=Acinetobacter calcoaceticus TaxID=471 RepID=A0A4R1XTZ8_ACICA|nr:P pilus assembly chaperone PapD [Acinetobacter calcoaceticus]